jgi:hypothetical protein
MRTAQRDSAEATRIIAATSGGGVSLATGPGWRIERVGAGVYDVRLSNVRAILAVQTSSITGVTMVVVASITQPDTFRVIAYNTASTATDVQFMFTATVR